MSSVRKNRATNKKRAEKPVSAGIHRAAERAGIAPSSDGTAARMATREAERRAISNMPIVLTLGEACEMIGRDVSAENFAVSAFQTIARDLDALSDLAESESHAGFDGWCLFQGLCARIEFAGKIVNLLGAKPKPDKRFDAVMTPDAQAASGGAQ